MTYNEAYNKIIEAYFKDEIRPYEASFCFCGTLCNGSSSWRRVEYKGIFSGDIHNDFIGYTGKEYADMEKALLLALIGCSYNNRIEYENRLFDGMCAALAVLRGIHIKRGEVIDEYLRLTQRQKLELCANS